MDLFFCLFSFISNDLLSCIHYIYPNFTIGLIAFLFMFCFLCKFEHTFTGNKSYQTSEVFFLNIVGMVDQDSLIE